MLSSLSSSCLADNKANVKSHQENKASPDIIRNLAPEGSVAKITGKEGQYFSGPAHVFEGEEAMIAAIAENPESFKGKVVVIRGEGPKCGPGMPEILTPTSAIMGSRSWKGGSHGFVIGHIFPEAQDGGPIGIVQIGDIITIDVEKRRMDVQLTDEEMAKRKKNWTPAPCKADRGVLYKERAASFKRLCD